jgi:hypothetical protein
MNRLTRNFICLICFFISLSVQSQKINPALLKDQWKASWIAVPGESATGYGVYLFRKSFELPAKPPVFLIHVSADNRYKLFVNGKQVSLGPARGDLEHWNFETLDIASFLHAGNNIIAAKVWNEGVWRPEGQISLRTGFIIQGNDLAENIINTGNDWKCIRDSAFLPLRVNLPTYYVAGPGEQVNMMAYLNGWEKPGFRDSSWKTAEIIMPGIPKNLNGGYGTVSGWLLIPSGIPPMELKNQRGLQIRNSEGIKLVPGISSEKNSITVPANTVATILFDQGFLINAYPEIIFSGGRQATISLNYAEALFTKYPSKGNRNETTQPLQLVSTCYDPNPDA